MITEKQATKIARMMLEAATYDPPFFFIHALTTRKEGREETLTAIAHALFTLTGIDESELLNRLTMGGCMDFGTIGDLKGKAEELQAKWQKAPIYRDGKNRQYLMFCGVYAQNGAYKQIDVERYADFEHTGKYRDVNKLREKEKRERRKYDELHEFIIKGKDELGQRL